jgi:cellobiose phosphorylase
MQLFSIINPVNHARTADDVQKYKVEPYVIAADVYSVAPHIGRGGWTWYTGSAGWFYRAGLEAILGVTRVGDYIHVKPCVPAGWDDVKVTVRIESTWYDIQLLRRSLRYDENNDMVKLHAAGHYTILHDNSSARRAVVISLTTISEAGTADLSPSKSKRNALG